MPLVRLCLAATLGLAALAALPARAAPTDVPPWLPRYDLDIRLDIDGHQAHVFQRITWINRHQRPAAELVFNAHSHFKVPDADVGKLAKTVELLRQSPAEAIDFDGEALQIQHVNWIGKRPAGIINDVEPLADTKDSDSVLPPPRPLESEPKELTFHYREDNQTALIVPLPEPVGPGETITVEVEFIMRLPQKQFRWGQWKGVTFLSNWLPVLAVYDECGWHPTPFVAWHQPFFNEAGIYQARVTLPCDQKIACTGTIGAVREIDDGKKQVDIAAVCARDFAFLCSACYQEFTGETVPKPGCPPVQVKVLAFPEHAHYAKEMVKIACEAIPTYSAWIGPFPYPQFTIAESYFGWNGNECGDLVMIDARIFAMPHIAHGYVEQLVSHEICHQWWYNIIGTNGYSETWMDEGMATYFSHRLMNDKHGKNNALLKLPRGLSWLPNIHRENYRHYGLYGSIGRGEACATVQDMDKFEHVVTLFSMCYDRGSKIVGLIEDRLGEAAFLDFIRLVYRKYRFQILRVADFQRELEAYTGRSWDEFFRFWLYGPGMTDWSLKKVKVERQPWSICHGCGPRCAEKGRTYKATVTLQYKAVKAPDDCSEYVEPTVLGIALKDDKQYEIRIPIVPSEEPIDIDDPPARIETLPHGKVRVEVTLPSKPVQMCVDPDHILLDHEPGNNHWNRKIRWRGTPLYTALEETDLTNDYDSWNVLAGPWFYGPAYIDPWYGRSTMFGLRAGFYRTQVFSGGVYTAYRTDFGDLVAGVDGLADHWPFPNTQVGFNADQRLTTPWGTSGPTDGNRGVLYGRYVFQYASSLYLPPIHHIEAFTAYQDNLLPFADIMPPGAQRPDSTGVAGLHYHIDYLTPYWDPDAGFRFDTTTSAGVTDIGRSQGYYQLNAQLSRVKHLPELDGPTCLSPVLCWLASTKVAMRAYGAMGLPSQGQYFALGGGSIFRGFDLSERQGSMLWVGSVEWRLPLLRDLNWDCCDHVAGVRNIYLAPFYDIGNVYVNNQTLGGMAHAVGAGLRIDVAWFSFIERTILRLDVAKTINASTPMQLWFGVQHPF